MKKSKAVLTYLSSDCPERKSVCCGVGSKEAKDGGYFICKQCLENFVGGKCNAQERMNKKMKKCPSCGKKTYIKSVFGSICSQCFYEEK